MKDNNQGGHLGVATFQQQQSQLTGTFPIINPQITYTLEGREGNGGLGKDVKKRNGSTVDGKGRRV